MHTRARSWLSLTRHNDPPPPADPPPADPPPADPPPADPGKTFDQSAVDRIVQDRLAREREKFADYDDLKTKAEKLAEIEASNQTELEKAIARAEAAESERDKFAGAITERDRRDIVLGAARDAKFIDPAQAYALIDQSKLTVDDAGIPTNAGDLVAELAKTSPHLVGAPPAPGSADGGAKPGGDAADYRTAGKDDFAKGLEGFGLRPRS